MNYLQVASQLVAKQRNQKRCGTRPWILTMPVVDTV